MRGRPCRRIAPAWAPAAVGEQIDGHRCERLGRRHVGELRIDDRVVGAVAGAASRRPCTGCRTGIRWLTSPMSVQPPLWPVRFTCSAPDQGGRRRRRSRRLHGGVVQQREGTGHRLDLNRGAERESARAKGAVDLAAGVEDALRRLAAHVHLQTRLARDDVHLRAAMGEDRMHADGVVVAKRLPHGVDGGEGELGGVERVDPPMRGAAGMGGAADEDAPPFLSRPLLDAWSEAWPAVGPPRHVDHHGQVDVVEVRRGGSAPACRSGTPGARRASGRCATRGRRPPRRAPRRTPPARPGGRRRRRRAAPWPRPAWPPPGRCDRRRGRPPCHGIALGMARHDQRRPARRSAPRWGRPRRVRAPRPVRR